MGDQVKAWQWLKKLIKTLTHDGMSSDESEQEGLELTYSTKTLPWRPDIRKELEKIDAVRMDQPTAYSSKGSKPVRRHWDERNPISTRQAVKGLPRNLYDEDWFEENPHLARKAQPSTEVFDWVQIL
jgi:hypothetical protein